MAEHEAVPALTVHRTAARAFTLRNDRGAELQLGMAGEDGSFTPGELLQAAVAGCAALSAEAQLAHKLGPGYEMTATTAASVDEAADLIESITVTLAAEMTELDDAARAKLVEQAERVIDRLCTVKRSVNHGIAATAVVQPR